MSLCSSTDQSTQESFVVFVVQSETSALVSKISDGIKQHSLYVEQGFDIIRRHMLIQWMASRHEDWYPRPAVIINTMAVKKVRCMLYTCLKISMC